MHFRSVPSRRKANTIDVIVKHRGERAIMRALHTHRDFSPNVFFPSTTPSLRMFNMESRNEGDKRKPGDFLHRKHPERREKKLHARRQYQHVPAIEQDYETNDQQHSARIPSPASLPYNGPDTPPPTSPATDCEDAPDGMQRESQNLSPRLTSSTSYDYLTTEDKQELTSLLDRKLLGIPTIHLPNLTLTDILYQSPKAVHLPQYGFPPLPPHF